MRDAPPRANSFLEAMKPKKLMAKTLELVRTTFESVIPPQGDRPSPSPSSPSRSPGGRGGDGEEEEFVMVASGTLGQIQLSDEVKSHSFQQLRGDELAREDGCEVLSPPPSHFPSPHSISILPSQSLLGRVLPPLALHLLRGQLQLHLRLCHWLSRPEERRSDLPPSASFPPLTLTLFSQAQPT